MRKITINLAAVAAFCIVVASPALVSSSCATPQTEQEDTTQDLELIRMQVQAMAELAQKQIQDSYRGIGQ